MNIQLFSSSPSLSLVCFLLVILVKIQSSNSSNPEFDPFCERQFQCRNIKVGYPFSGGARWEGCGHPKFKLNCERPGDHDVPTMMINDVKYWVLDINLKAQTLRIAKILSYLHGVCPEFYNSTFDSQLFKYSDTCKSVTLHYGCPASPINEPQGCGVNDVIYEDEFIHGGVEFGQGGCNANVTVPVPESFLPPGEADFSKWQQILQQGFELTWKIGGMACEECIDSKGGICGFDHSSNETLCYCPHPGQPLWERQCPSESSFKRTGILIKGIAAGVVGSVGIIIVFCIFRIRGQGRNFIWKNKTENRLNMEAFVRNFGSLAPTRYNYPDVKKMTKSFNNKLGQGGYGDVYKGKLLDGRLVAVKLLKGSKGNGEEFTNEVASISRTSHVNIVNLLGFCYERNKRALIYEFMPNGSLDKFIYDQESSTTNRILEWKTIYQIAVGIGRGLEYLHQGCNTRIVHFDIKPHNILLDEDFCPKISDFGLAKLCKRKESVVSMLGARGTIGYIAPEVSCRSFGEVSHKSDVYSYGMMIFEMVGGRKNIDTRVSHTSEIYFPNWIYKKLESSNDFEFYGAVTQEEKELAKRMVLVSLWCIQTFPSDRPPMSRVLEMLEGSLEYLQVPPKPSLASRTRSPQLFPSISSSSSPLSVQLA